jgi:GMP synthase-like glutamine amidotransferase
VTPKRVLLINNESAHFERLKELVIEEMGRVQFTICGTKDSCDEQIKQSDLVILSGGSTRSIEKNPGTFRRMVKPIVAFAKPAIGICLGAEALAVHFGGRLVPMPVRRVGNIPIYFSEAFNAELGIGNEAKVYEFHRWLIDGVSSPLESLATSKDGVELFRHTKLPLWGMQFHPEIKRLNNSGHLIFRHALKQIGCL